MMLLKDMLLSCPFRKYHYLKFINIQEITNLFRKKPNITLEISPHTAASPVILKISTLITLMNTLNVYCNIKNYNIVTC